MHACVCANMHVCAHAAVLACVCALVAVPLLVYIISFTAMHWVLHPVVWIRCVCELPLLACCIFFWVMMSCSAALLTQAIPFCACIGSIGRAFSRRPNMGDFPRWVDREDVDSQAMFSAILNYEFKTKNAHFGDEAGWRPVWYGHLHMINHRANHGHLGGVRVDQDSVKNIDCEKRPCRRCDTGVGGYQFRWYSPLWAKWYNKTRREGSWKAPEPMVDMADKPCLHFWEYREDAWEAP